jgi:hypothetical protein
MTKAFKCPYCNREYKTSRRLITHLIIKHDRSYKVVFAMLAIFGIIATLGGIVYNDQIDYFWDKFILKKSPDVKISLNQIMWMGNPYGFINISNETGMKIRFDCMFYETCAIYKNESTGQLQLLLGNDTMVDGFITWYHYEYPNGSVEDGCIFNYPLKLKYEAYTRYNYTYWFPLDEAINLRDSGCPYSDTCILGTFTAYNFGNKKLTDFKSEVCIDGEILYVDGDVEKEYGNCLELRSENFLPGDSLSGVFYSKPPSVVEEFSAYDELNGNFPKDHLVYIVHIMMPNCS